MNQRETDRITKSTEYLTKGLIEALEKDKRIEDLFSDPMILDTLSFMCSNIDASMGLPQKQKEALIYSIITTVFMLGAHMVYTVTDLNKLY